MASFLRGSFLNVGQLLGQLFFVREISLAGDHDALGLGEPAPCMDSVR